MTIQCKEVLKHLKKLSNNSNETLCFVGDLPHICRNDNLDDFFDYSKYKNEIESIIQSLVGEGYLMFEFNEYHFHLTQKAIHRTQHNMGVLIKFLICSIIVPMAVSLATSLIVLYIQGLL